MDGMSSAWGKNKPDDELSMEMFALPDHFKKRRRETPPANALVPQDDGSIVNDRYTITATGITFADDLSADEWRQVGRLIRTVESAAQWMVGDWAVYAMSRWGASYEQLADEFEYEIETLRQYAYVSRNVNPLIRNRALTFSHHRMVADMPARLQGEALAKAFGEDGRPLRVEDFRAVLKGLPSRTSAGSPKLSQNPAGYFDYQLDTLAGKMIGKSKSMSVSEKQKLADKLRQIADELNS